MWTKEYEFSNKILHKWMYTKEYNFFYFGCRVKQVIFRMFNW